jgi:threonyl-tRNA synthetase
LLSASPNPWLNAQSLPRWPLCDSHFQVDGALFDLTRPLEKSCKLQLLDFDSDDGKKVFWHSSAHVLGAACESHFGCNLVIGPNIEDGFFYEMSMQRYLFFLTPELYLLLITTLWKLWQKKLLLKSIHLFVW